MLLNKLDTQRFREVLRVTGFCPQMKKTTRDHTWSLLEQYVGAPP